jgi:phasin
MRAMADQSVAQARRAFEGFMGAAQAATSAIEGQTAAAAAGARDVRQKAMSFAEQNVATSFDFARQLTQARDLEEVMRLQAEFARKQMQSLTQQAQELGQAATKAAMDSAKPKTG